MKNRILIFGLLLLFVVGCSRHKVAKELMEFRNSEIVLPSELQKVHDRNISGYSDEGKSVRQVIYYDSTECSTCRISHLVDLLELYELEEKCPEFQAVTVFSPSEDKYDEVMAELMKRDFQYPVYVDYGGEFRKSNRHIPDDNRFHSFLLDRNMKPVFVGNPVAGNELWDLFEQTLDNLAGNGGIYKD